MARSNLGLSWVQAPLLQPVVQLRPVSWLGMALRWRELSLWSTARVRAANLWKPVMPDLAWLYGAYAMMGQMGVAQPVVHRQHIHQQRSVGQASGRRIPQSRQTATSKRRAQGSRKNHRTFSPPAILAQGPQTIGFTAPTHHIHSQGARPSVPETLKRARQRGLGQRSFSHQGSPDNRTLLAGMVPVAAATVSTLSQTSGALRQAKAAPSSTEQRLSGRGLSPRPMWTKAAAPEGAATARLIYEYGAWNSMHRSQGHRQAPQAVAQQLLRQRDLTIEQRTGGQSARLAPLRKPTGNEPTWRQEKLHGTLGGMEIRQQSDKRRARPVTNELNSMIGSLDGVLEKGDVRDFAEPVLKRRLASVRRPDSPRSFSPAWAASTQPISQGLFLKPPVERTNRDLASVQSSEEQSQGSRLTARQLERNKVVLPTSSSKSSRSRPALKSAESQRVEGFHEPSQRSPTTAVPQDRSSQSVFRTNRGVFIPNTPLWHETVSGLQQRGIKRPEDSFAQLSPQDRGRERRPMTTPVVGQISFVAPPQRSLEERDGPVRSGNEPPRGRFSAQRDSVRPPRETLQSRTEHQKTLREDLPRAQRPTPDFVRTAQAKPPTVSAKPLASAPMRVRSQKTLQWRDSGSWSPKSTEQLSVIQEATPRSLQAPNVRFATTALTQRLIEPRRDNSAERSPRNSGIQTKLNEAVSTKTQARQSNATSPQRRAQTSPERRRTSRSLQQSNEGRREIGYVSVRQSPQWQAQPILIRPNQSQDKNDISRRQVLPLSTAPSARGANPEAAASRPERGPEFKGQKPINASTRNKLREAKSTPMNSASIGSGKGFAGQEQALGISRDAVALPAPPIKLLTPLSSAGNDAARVKASNEQPSQRETKRSYPSIRWAHQPAQKPVLELSKAQVRRKRQLTNAQAAAVDSVSSISAPQRVTTEPLPSNASEASRVTPQRISVNAPPLAWRQHQVMSGQLSPRVMTPVAAFSKRSESSQALPGAPRSSQNTSRTEQGRRAELEPSRSSPRASARPLTSNKRPLKESPSSEASSVNVTDAFESKSKAKNRASLAKRAVFVPARPNWLSLKSIQRSVVMPSRGASQPLSASTVTPSLVSAHGFKVGDDDTALNEGGIQKRRLQKAPQREPRIVQALAANLALLRPMKDTGSVIEPARASTSVSAKQSNKDNTVSRKPSSSTPRMKRQAKKAIPTVNWSRQPVRARSASQPSNAEPQRLNKRLPSQTQSRNTASQSLSLPLIDRVGLESKSARTTPQSFQSTTLPRNLLMPESGFRDNERLSLRDKEQVRRGETVMQTANRRFEYLRQTYAQQDSERERSSLQSPSSQSRQVKQPSRPDRKASVYSNLRQGVRLKRGMPRRILQTQFEQAPAQGPRTTERSRHIIPQQTAPLSLVVSPNRERIEPGAPNQMPVQARTQSRTPRPKAGDLSPQRLLRGQKTSASRSQGTTSGQPPSMAILSDAPTQFRSGVQLIADTSSGLVEPSARPALSFLMPSKAKDSRNDMGLTQKEGRSGRKKNKKKNKKNPAVSVGSGQKKDRTKSVIRPHGVFEEELSSDEELIEDAPPSTGGISWSAPEAFQPKSVQNDRRRPTPSNSNSQVSSSDKRNREVSIEDLAEETILAILTELSTSSPEAQALLDDVYRQVEHIRRINKFRQI